VAAEVIGGLHPQDVPDVLVCVVDASNLERNLVFFSQLLGTQTPTIVALTMTDTLEAEGTKINIEKLSELLGVPVVPVIAHKSVGLSELKSVIGQAIGSGVRPEVDLGFPSMVRKPVFQLHEMLARAGIDVTKSSVREALLDENAALNRKLVNNPEFVEAFDEARKKILGETGQGKTVDAQSRYAWAGRVKSEVILASTILKRSTSDRLDAVLTHRFWGLIAFVGMMYLVFQSIYTLAQPLMGLVETGQNALKAVVEPLLTQWPVVQSLVVGGVITGVGTVVMFLPQILILFFFVAVLEGSGYLARAAFLMDRLLGWCGLNGRAFIPLLSSFACAVPGIMAARVMPDHKSRLATILVAPLMSCSARLPVYILFIGVFIEPRYGAFWAGFSLFAMHIVGLLVSIPVVYVFNRALFRKSRLPFVLELPRYQAPRIRDIWRTMVSRAKVFLNTAGTIIFVMSIVIWALLYFPRSPESDARYRTEYQATYASAEQKPSLDQFMEARRTEDSFLGRFGKAIEPAFRPIGLDWRLTTSVLAAFPAREVVVSAMGIIFDLGGEVDEGSSDLRRTLREAKWPDGRPLVTLWTAISLMLFFALCCQCMATLAAIKRETGSWKWPVFTFVYMTVLAYLLSVIVFQFGSRLAPNI
ncbi:MAG: ferrous iron transport protein B, partial [Chthonomonadaceae bacterium]|nr:ferrous iron transport protein B [Chthonomonadaceae bacterium]